LKGSHDGAAAWQDFSEEEGDAEVEEADDEGQREDDDEKSNADGDELASFFPKADDGTGDGNGAEIPLRIHGNEGEERHEHEEGKGGDSESDGPLEAAGAISVEDTAAFPAVGGATFFDEGNVVEGVAEMTRHPVVHVGKTRPGEVMGLRHGPRLVGRQGCGNGRRDSFGDAFEKAAKNIRPGNNPLMLGCPVEDHVTVNDVVVRVVCLDHEFAEDGVEVGFFFGDDDRAVALGVDIGFFALDIEVAEELGGIHDDDGGSGFVHDDSPAVVVFFEGFNEGLSFVCFQTRKDGEVEFAGELVDGVGFDLIPFFDDFSVVKVEEIQCALAFIGTNFGVLLVDMTFQDDFNITLLEENGPFRSDPDIEENGAGLGDGVEDDLIKADDGGEDAADFEGISREVGLRHDFAEDGDSDGREDEAADPKKDLTTEEGEEDIHADVSPQDGAEEEVGILPEIEDLGSSDISALRFGFESKATEREKGKVAPGKHRGVNNADKDAEPDQNVFHGSYVLD
jgi:hypothetical protein